jgi:hypothetical protein
LTCPQEDLGYFWEAILVFEASAPLLSIICPVWKMEGKLQNLQTWISQISDSVEVVLVYDESPDETLKELEGIVGCHQRPEQIKILTGKFGSITVGDGVVQDNSASTAWWVDYSNFFQGFS